MFALGKNIGYDFAGGVVAHKSNENFAEKRQYAWDMVRKAIGEGIPCYGWELEVPEFYVINGYDDVGYYSGGGADPIKGPKPWQELGESDIGMIEVYSVRRGQPADDATTVKEAFEFVLEHAGGPEKWVLPGYKVGLAGYDNWIETVANGEAHALRRGAGISRFSPGQGPTLHCTVPNRPVRRPKDCQSADRMAFAVTSCTKLSLLSVYASRSVVWYSASLRLRVA